MVQDPIERAARALFEYEPGPYGDCVEWAVEQDFGWRDRVEEVKLVLAAIREPSEAGFVLVPRKLVDDAADYLIGDAEAWEKGSDGHPREVYLKHCGKLRRDIAASLRAVISAAQEPRP